MDNLDFNNNKFFFNKPFQLVKSPFSQAMHVSPIDHVNKFSCKREYPLRFNSIMLSKPSDLLLHFTILLDGRVNGTKLP